MEYFCGELRPLLYETSAPHDMRPLETRGEYLVRTNLEGAWREICGHEELRPTLSSNGTYDANCDIRWLHYVAMAYKAAYPVKFEYWAKAKQDFDKACR